MIISVINNTWKSTIVVTGMSDFPEAEIADNDLIKSKSCRISIRTHPTLSKEKAKKIIYHIMLKLKLIFQLLLMVGYWKN